MLDMFVRAIVEAVGQPRICKVNGIERLTIPVGNGSWTLADIPTPEPMPQAVEVESLSGLVGYLKANRDGLDHGQLLVHVESPECVSLLGRLTEDFVQRPRLLEATLAFEPYQFGVFHDHESFMIALQSLFEPTPERQKILELVGSIKEENVRESADDGFSQAVTAREGAALAKTVKVPNPVKLVPFRT